MNFLAVLDYEHLDNGMFLASFARALSRKKETGIIIHRDSEYTERIIQTGVMREEATIRSAKDLNHRLVALFADEGVATVAVNGYQKSMIQIRNEVIKVDDKQLKQLPGPAMILISNLALNENGNIEPVPLPDLAGALQKVMNIDLITIFSIQNSADVIVQDFPKTIELNHNDSKILSDHIPEGFRNSSLKVSLCTPSSF